MYDSLSWIEKEIDWDFAVCLLSDGLTQFLMFAVCPMCKALA